MGRAALMSGRSLMAVALLALAGCASATDAHSSGVASTVQPTPNQADSDSPIEDVEYDTPQRLVGNYSESGDGRTEVFTVCGPWSIEWIGGGGPFSITIRDPEGLPLLIPLRGSGPVHESVEVSERGTWYIEVSAEGDWQLNIIDLASYGGDCRDDTTTHQEYMNGEPAG